MRPYQKRTRPWLQSHEFFFTSDLTLRRKSMCSNNATNCPRVLRKLNDNVQLIIVFWGSQLVFCVICIDIQAFRGNILLGSLFPRFLIKNQRPLSREISCSLFRSQPLSCFWVCASSVNYNIEKVRVKFCWYDDNGNCLVKRMG